MGIGTGTAQPRPQRNVFQAFNAPRQPYSFQCLFILFNYEIFIVTNVQSQRAFERHQWKWHSIHCLHRNDGNV